jgi:alkanesulfonate monooxygenase SsuD/methylene tetrahydromethanopterin reductase-like flavin-dependent oxidoreductase (luciferase family)
VRYGIEITNLGDYADPRAVVRLARRAEASGWEGLFIWDHLGFVWGAPTGDPWIILSAVAASTARLTLGTAVTPLPRRRVQVVANELATLDLLSGGRAVFGAGIGGVPEEFTACSSSRPPRSSPPSRRGALIRADPSLHARRVSAASCARPASGYTRRQWCCQAAS